MAEILCYYIRCDFPGCREWNGAIREHPEQNPELEADMLRRMGWDRDPDLCPEHRGSDLAARSVAAHIATEGAA